MMELKETKRQQDEVWKLLGKFTNLNELDDTAQQILYTQLALITSTALSEIRTLQANALGESDNVFRPTKAKIPNA